ncbi:MAG: hypothetical protein AB8W37_08775 [Arsenophonus endosymbiont of Dermacentor nuttalli]
MEAHKWLQWVLLPRHMLLLNNRLIFQKYFLLLSISKRSIKQNRKVTIANYWNIYAL